MLSELRRFAHSCVRILRQEAKPLHSKVLARRALAEMNPPYFPTKAPEEDLREKIAMRRQCGTFYVPEPDCVVGLIEWFEKTPLLLNSELKLFRKEGSASLSYKIALRMDKLAGRLLTKKADHRWRAEGKARGITVEEYMQEWFEERFPKFYRRESSDRASPTDFFLKKWRFDVASVRDDDLVGMPNDKKQVDFHVFGKIIEKDVFLQGFLPGRELPPRNFPIESSRPIGPFLVWLQCLHDGIDYKRLERIALEGKPAYRVKEIMDAT